MISSDIRYKYSMMLMKGIVAIVVIFFIADGIIVWNCNRIEAQICGDIIGLIFITGWGSVALFIYWISSLCVAIVKSRKK